MTLIEEVDYFVRFWIMPPKIYSFIIPNDDGTFSIYLDPRRDYYHRMKDLEHELNHIRNGDFYNGLPIQTIEDYL